jgi:hypothetical protein
MVRALLMNKLCTVCWGTSANFASFPVPPKGTHILKLSSLFLLLFGFADLVLFIGKYCLVDSGYPNRQGYLAPFKEAHTIYKSFDFEMGVLLNRSMRCSISCIHRLEVSLSELSGSWSQSGAFWRKFHVIPLVLKNIYFVACMSLHNFIRDSQLRDKVFDEFDANDEYLLP